MLKSSSPIPQPEEPADGEADRPGAAPSQGGTAPRDLKAPRRYEVPEADALSELPNRPHAQTVRGQIQRVRLDLLARENERLDHQLRELRQQQNDYQEKDSAWRDGWQKRLVDLSGQVDHLISEAEAAREVEPEPKKDDGPELRDTVKPLLLAVLEMLDDTDGQGRPVRPDAARAAAAAQAAKSIAPAEPALPAAVLPEPPRPAPAAPPVIAESDPPAVAEPAEPVPDLAEAPVPTTKASGLEPLADEALLESRPALASIGRMESWDPVPAAAEADPADATPPEPAPESVPGPVELAEPAEAKASFDPASWPEVPSGAEKADLSDQAQSFSPDDESAGDDMAIEIARLLLPQGDSGDNDDLLFEPVPATEPEPEAAVAKDDTQEAPQPQDDLPDEVDQSGETLVLGTDETPQIAHPEPAAVEITKPKATEASPFEDWRAKSQHRGTGASSKFAASGLDRPMARRKPASGEQPVVGEDADASEPGSRAQPLHRESEPRPDPEPEPDVPTEPLPRCLTERWEDADTASSERGQPAQPRDKGTYRWPFRRLRATIDHDHAHADSETEPNALRRPRGNTRFGEKLE